MRKRKRYFIVFYRFRVKNQIGDSSADIVSHNGLYFNREIFADKTRKYFREKYSLADNEEVTISITDVLELSYSDFKNFTSKK